MEGYVRSMAIDEATARSWVGHPLYDANDSKLGTIEAVYFDDATGAPAWAALPGSGLSTTKAYVPIDGLRATPKGHLVVPFLKDALKDAPTVQALDGKLTPEDLGTLSGHFRGRHAPTPADSTEPGPLGQPFRGSSNESTFGSGQVGPGEPDDLTAQGTGHSDNRSQTPPDSTT